jgi:hypothetical protein
VLGRALKRDALRCVAERNRRRRNVSGQTVRRTIAFDDDRPEGKVERAIVLIEIVQVRLRI